MSKTETAGGGLVASAARAAKKAVKGGGGETLAALIAEYFDHVPPQDLNGRHAPDLMRMVKAHMELGAGRKAGKSHVRLFVPDQKRDGWSAERLVLQLVGEDMPFLVDSVTAAVNRRGLGVHLVIHPIFKVFRDAGGKLVRILKPGESDEGAVMESWMHLEVDEAGPSEMKALRADVVKTLKDVRVSVQDWRPMREKMARVIDDLARPVAAVDDEARTEVREFLRWARDNNFIFLGYRFYAIEGGGEKVTVSVDAKSGRGLLRDPGTLVFDELADMAQVPGAVRRFITTPNLLMVTKGNHRSTVHRPAHLDALVIKTFDAKGKVAGQHIFAGLFTSAAYNKNPRDIPQLRRRIQRVAERAGLPPGSHDGKALLNILETYPRDELFQVSEDHLFETAMGVLHLQERQRTALFVRKDEFERFMSCLVYVPRDRHTTELREKIQEILGAAFDGRPVVFSTLLGDAPLARIHMIIATRMGKIPPYDVGEIEKRLAAAARSWSDRLLERMSGAYGEREALRLNRRYGKAFGPGYQAAYDGPQAMEDIAVMERMIADQQACAAEGLASIGLSLFRGDGGKENTVRFKTYHLGRNLPLSDVLPVFEHMGFRVLDERPYEIRPSDSGGVPIILQDFGLETRDGQAVHIPAIRDKFEEAFLRVWRGEIESDGFNGLVALGGLTWREVVVLRAYCKCLRQMGIPYSQAYMESALARYLDITKDLIRLFTTRFDPDAAFRKKADREKAAAGVLARVEHALEGVSSADDDKILTRFINLIEQTLRTNFFQKDSETGGPKTHVSFKFASQGVTDLPLPRPLREIFVYSPRVEGAHLRFGYVARGGLRWSDRHEDFRTEILGLVKAQQVKNAVIVPVGSKGGFVVKRPPAEGGREAFQAEGVECYKIFISGLLDVTDNLKGAKVAPPRRVERRDDDDPYLVVAADKGTATFSDIANGVSADYGHWLGDAFASGGSRGYDHKGMGITAKGAWESVKRHFREMGLDTQTRDFTVCGVGDMSGDVFGNGMLLSGHIKLLGAFNHLHIFCDPNPDPKKSFQERKRLFDMGRSAWTDYDPKIMSKGGMIYERSAKSLKLTPEIKKCFGLARDNVTPNELMTAILTSSADLMWFGGIGTYVKASTESNSDAGDRANDAIRVNGGDMKCKVIGEGANLGCTQLGRIEYALRGGRLNTDSIDNSAGVDCSDHEVNIKILLNAPMGRGEMSGKQRNNLLARMTDEVSELVLAHNYRQTQAITLISSRGFHALDSQSRLMRMLEREGVFNRAVEFLPDEETLQERAAAKHGLARPEVSVLISHAKNWLYERILESGVPDDAYLTDELVSYFPTPLRGKLLPDIKGHRLRREIIATRVTNSMIDRVGETFVSEFMEKTGQDAPEIARAYVIARQVLNLRPLWTAIEALDNKAPAHAQTSMLEDINHLLQWVTLWFLRNGQAGLDIGAHIAEYGPGMTRLAGQIGKVVPPHYIDDMKRRAAPYLNDKAPQSLAHRISHLVNLYSACDIIRLANKRRMDVGVVAQVYFAIGTRFRLGRLRAAASGLDSDTHWRQLANDALVEEIYNHQLGLASHALDHMGRNMKPAKVVDVWIAANRAAVDQTEILLNELWQTEVSDLSMVAVASRQLRQLAEANG